MMQAFDRVQARGRMEVACAAPHLARQVVAHRGAGRASVSPHPWVGRAAFQTCRGALVVLALTLAGCATGPLGPSLPALPGSGQTLAQFQLDDAGCRAWAEGQDGSATAQRAAQDAVASGALTGGAVGAVAGAALGGSKGVGAGAVTGALFGAAVGQGNAYESRGTAQRRYDHAYVQCMYSLGHRVPMREGVLPLPAPPSAASGPAVPRVPRPAPLPPAGPPPPPPPSWRSGAALP